MYAFSYLSVTGIAVVDTSTSPYGSWEYRLNCSGSWQPMVVQNNTTPYGAANSNLHLLLLKPSDCIRFSLSNCKTFWTKKDGLEKVNFFSFAWDMSDRQTSGLVRLSIPSDGSFPTAYSRNVLTVIQLRKGCNGKPGSVALIDRCGVCGGDNSSCRGCDGGFRSGARIGKDFFIHLSYLRDGLSPGGKGGLCAGHNKGK